MIKSGRMYSKRELLDGLSTKIIGRRLFVFDEIDSTNTCAKALADTGMEDGTVVIADHQTAGRGRLGRAWIADPASNLLLSIILRPRIGQAHIGLLPLFVAAGVALAIEDATGKKVECKWPNDLVVSGRKFCGILLESLIAEESLDYAVVGIGLNVNQKTFSDALKDRATSLLNESGSEYDRRLIFQRTLKSLDTLYGSVRKDDFSTALREWNLRARMFGQSVSLTQGDQVFTGIARHIADDGGLVLETPAGNRTFYAGDVTIKES
jgi:BirA family biotin operon repressor/biotin-[acetyl-CoA-carboxylase] ligase